MLLLTYLTTSTLESLWPIVGLCKYSNRKDFGTPPSPGIYILGGPSASTKSFNQVAPLNAELSQLQISSY